MKRRQSLLALVALAAVIAGCASGPKYQDVAKSIPALKPNEGRVFFFRSSSVVGAAVQADIRLNGTVVGTSIPGGFFYVDRPAGNYVAASSTETEKTLSFTLAAGETKYVRSSVGLGLLVGRVILELEDPKAAQAEIETLSYTGGPDKK
ncbi:MAG: DUF2846 domain-containing protein [Burkholderiales bacterium]|jgi:hypothetical protein|nr:DUF2846 domain-containing protein [Burkholderiales bacterium]